MCLERPGWWLNHEGTDPKLGFEVSLMVERSDFSHHFQMRTVISTFNPDFRALVDVDSGLLAEKIQLFEVFSKNLLHFWTVGGPDKGRGLLPYVSFQEREYAECILAYKERLVCSW